MRENNLLTVRFHRYYSKTTTEQVNFIFTHNEIPFLHNSIFLLKVLVVATETVGFRDNQLSPSSKTLEAAFEIAPLTNYFHVIPRLRSQGKLLNDQILPGAY